MDIVNEVPGSVFAFVSEDIGAVTLQITAFEDISLRVFSQNDLASATREKLY